MPCTIDVLEGSTQTFGLGPISNSLVFSFRIGYHNGAVSKRAAKFGGLHHTFTHMRITQLTWFTFKLS
jgi:hypothetical protein